MACAYIVVALSPVATDRGVKVHADAVVIVAAPERTCEERTTQSSRACLLAFNIHENGSTVAEVGCAGSGG